MRLLHQRTIVFVGGFNCRDRISWSQICAGLDDLILARVSRPAFLSPAIGVGFCFNLACMVIFFSNNILHHCHFGGFRQIKPRVWIEQPKTNMPAL